MADFWEEEYKKNPEAYEGIKGRLLSHLRLAEKIPYDEFTSSAAWSDDLYIYFGSSVFDRLFKDAGVIRSSMEPVEVVIRARYGPTSKPHEEADALLGMLVGTRYEDSMTFRNKNGNLKGTWLWDVYLMARSDWGVISGLAVEYQKMVTKAHQEPEDAPDSTEEPEPNVPQPEEPSGDPGGSEEEEGETLSTEEQRALELSSGITDWIGHIIGVYLKRDHDKSLEGARNFERDVLRNLVHTYRKVHAVMDKYLASY